jgi:hypothetical protein
MFEKGKQHIKDNKKFYIGLGIGITVAGVVYYVMRNNGAEIAIVSENGDAIFGDNNTTNRISYTLIDRQGPPSWIVENVRTGAKYMSQNELAKARGYFKSDVSKHLRDNVPLPDDEVFRRIGMAINSR